MGPSAYLFDSTATLKRATIGQGAQKGTTQNYNKVLGTNIPCTLQESNSTVQDVYGQRNTVVSAQILFAQDPGCEANDIAVVTDALNDTKTFLIEGRARPVGRGITWTVAAKLIRQPT